MPESEELIYREMCKPRIYLYREWFRQNMPKGQGGLVVTDNDLLLNRFGPLIGRDYRADGRLMYIEVKRDGASIDYAQQRTFDLQDSLSKTSTMKHDHYDGKHLLEWRGPELPDVCPTCKQNIKHFIKNIDWIKYNVKFDGGDWLPLETFGEIIKSYRIK